MPAEHWKLRTKTLAFRQTPLLMGIVNVTPDSFSDGNRYFEPQQAIEHGLQLAAEGADILDIGGESTRPGSLPVDKEEEIRRIQPVIAALAKQTNVPISIDTQKAAVARTALDAGAEILNDITAFEGDAAMLPLAAEAHCGVCIMHMQGRPQTMQQNPTYTDVVAEVYEYLQRRRDVLLAAGIEQDRIALDPGIGFGKTTAHNLQILQAADRFHSLGCPILIGHSRKRFLAETLAVHDGTAPHATASASSIFNRTSGVIGVALAMAQRRVQILRVHDVAAVHQALLLFEATGGLG